MFLNSKSKLGILFEVLQVAIVLGTTISPTLAALTNVTTSQLSYGGAGLAMFFRETLDFPDEISYRTVMVESYFTEDVSLMPHMIAQCDGGSPSLFNSLKDVTMEAWVKPVPQAQQFTDKGCCWPVVGTYLNANQMTNHLSLVFTDDHSLSFVTGHSDPNDLCNQIIVARSPMGLFASVWDGGWHHIAATFSSTTLVKSYYLDGKLVHNMTCGSPLSVTGGSVFLGTTLENNPKAYWEGTLDEIRIWKVARTVDEIRSTMNRVLSSSEVNATVAYYNFDEYDPLGVTGKVKDLGPNSLDVTLGMDQTMPFAENRLMPNPVPSGANIRGSNVSLVLHRATTRYNGTTVLSSLVDTTTTLGASASITLQSIFPSSFGVDIQADGSVVTAAQIPYTFSATKSLIIVAKSNADFKLKDGNYSIPVQVTAPGLTSPINFHIVTKIQTPKPVGPGSAGTALFCNGRDHAYAKDFSFGQTYTAPSYTVEFWAYQFLILPVQFPTTVFSIGNWEVSFPDSWCWGVKSPGVPNASFCKGRLELDLPDVGGWMIMYSGWNAGNGDGQLAVDAKPRYGTLL
ncbi:hypothetical protein HDU76_004776 [Blyttiomyces sp. JEL0837]|nr:hypothetical protein HDU76_004776 [Blyttiomyces sp. JEL0837]